jgi:capsular exopolysaccharide synthesis family protein
MSRNFQILQRDEDDRWAVNVSVKIEPKLHPPANEPPLRRNRTSVANDQITKLVQQVFLLPCKPGAPQAVTFSATQQGDGCSWVCIRTAEALAAQDVGSVCLVDANLRAPSFHNHFKFNNGFGLADAVYDSRPVRDFAVRDGFRNLWVITAGNVGRNANAVLNMSRLRTRLTELRTEFEYILIDTPPIVSYGDGALIGKLTDGVILVVGSNSARRDAVRVAKETMDSANIPILGAVLNKRTFPIPEMIYRNL